MILVAVAFPEDLTGDRGTVEVNISVKDFDPNVVNFGNVVVQGSPEWKWAGKQITFTSSKFVENFTLSITKTLAKGFFEDARGQILDVLASLNGKTIYAAASYTSLENFAGFHVAVPSISSSSSTVYTFVLRATPIEVVRSRCEAGRA